MKRLRPSVIVFDVDGVLVDARHSFHRTALETVEHFTQRRFTNADLHRWKDQPGYNDDWRLTTDWVNSLGVRVSYDDVKRQFIKLYWGTGSGKPGNSARERWIAPRSMLRRLARRFELAIFTGRIREELRPTLDRFRAAAYFQQIVTTSDVVRSKPYPDGLLRILRERAPQSALYLGDNVDDAASAHAAQVPFVGVLAADTPHRRRLAENLKERGALRVINGIDEIERWLA